MIRATTGGVLKSYRYNLMNSFISMNKARETVLTQRQFNSYAEDPAAAARAFKLRKSRMAVESQTAICDDAYKKHQTAFKCLDTIDKLIDTKNGTEMSTLKGTTLEMLNDPKGDARTQLSKVLDQLSQTIVQTMNQKYGDNFIFAGADGHNVPFEVKDNALYYRGVPVDAAEPKLLPDNDAPLQLDDGSYVLADASTICVQEFVENPPGSGTPLTVTQEDGTTTNVLAGATPLTKTAYDALPDDEKKEYMKVDNNGTEEYYKYFDLASKADYDAEVAGSAMKKADGTYYTVTIDGQDCYIVNDPANVISKQDFDAAKTDADKLKYLVNEKAFVDIGLGFQENENGQLIESSGFNAALNGLTFLGYGADEDGDPKNIYSLVQKLREVADSVPDGGNWSDQDYEEFRRLVGKLETASSEYKTQFTNMDAGTTKLKNNLALLEDNFYNLQEQYAALEDVDMVDSITSFIWAQYCYNAALKVGNNVLSESLMDYLN